MNETYDFCGWATRNDIECSDGRIIGRDAFKDCDGKVVPLVWNHQHDNVKNVLGHALLINKPEGVFTYGKFNDSEEGQDAKVRVINKDITGLSIYANRLKQNGPRVMHGAIREVSLVLAGANPGAYIEDVMAHSEDGVADEAILYSGDEIDLCQNEEVVEHAESSEKTVKEVYDAMSEEKKNVINFLVGSAISGDLEANDKGEVKHADASSDGPTIGDILKTFTKDEETVLKAILATAMKNNETNENEGDNSMKHNVFESDNKSTAAAFSMSDLINEAKRNGGSLADAYLAHADEDDDAGDTPAPYGIGVPEGVSYTMGDVLFPEFQNLNKTPMLINNPDAWVKIVMNGVHHTPFSRVRTTWSDISDMSDELLRAKGYIKGHQKKEEFITVCKRTTDPQTIYKKQKLDRDDIIDITDFDVVAFLKAEMRLKLEEEIARAILVGDGRLASSEDKINETHVRPIWTDDDYFTIKQEVPVASTATEDDVAKAIIRAAVKARKDYKGSGNLTFFTTEDTLTDMLLLEDGFGHRLYKNEGEIASAMRASRVVTTVALEGLTRSITVGSNTKTATLKGLLVNLADYNVGADKGGQVSMFDDFDIDFNQQKYLIETRVSGALIKPYSAIAIETYTA